VERAHGRDEGDAVTLGFPVANTLAQWGESRYKLWHSLYIMLCFYYASLMTSTSPLARYDARTQAGSLSHDPAQREAMLRLDALAQSFGKSRETGLIGRLLAARKESPAGLYLWGEVGRGKSMLMELFFESVPESSKRRIHFHAFMLDVHRRLHAFRQSGEQDVLPRVVEDIAGETRLLCLDEFQVTDVTDAMILARLFTGLFDAGVVVVMTSNRHPRDLYHGGLQRDQFLKFVALAEQKMQIIALHSPTDYRLKQLRAMTTMFFHPLGDAADAFLVASWAVLTDGATSSELELEVQGRRVLIEKYHAGIAWLTFDELCARPLGANDYLELARVCHTVLLQNIPKLRIEDRNEAKRFVTLIDALYEHHVRLIATADTAPEDIYPSGDGSFEFQRTVSRLHEMQSERYLAQEHEG
jgi:cell division protein ZapE